MWKAKHVAALSLWLACLTSSMDVHESLQHLMYTPSSGGHYLLTGESCRVQWGHDAFKSSKNTTPGYFLIIKDAERATLYLFGGSHMYVFYTEKPENAYKCPGAERNLYFSKTL